MRTILDELLERIDPALTTEQVSGRVDNAINTFKLDDAILPRWDEFRYILTSFCCHVDNHVLRINPSRGPHPEMDWHRCSRLLTKEFGPQGEKAAFEIGRTGMEGGLYRVLKSIAMRMIEEYTGCEISARVGCFWGRLSSDEKVAVMDEYLTKYGHLLPSELTERGAARIKVNFPKVLEEHPGIIRRLRGIASLY